MLSHLNVKPIGTSYNETTINFIIYFSVTIKSIDLLSFLFFHTMKTYFLNFFSNKDNIFLFFLTFNCFPKTHAHKNIQNLFGLGRFITLSPPKFLFLLKTKIYKIITLPNESDKKFCNVNRENCVF